MVRTTKTNKKQPAKTRLFRSVTKQSTATKQRTTAAPAKVKSSNHGRRVKRLAIRLTATKNLQFTLRKFKTSPNSRSKLKRQLVLHLYLLPFKELAVTKVRVPKQRIKPAASALWLPLPKSALLLLTLGLLGTTFFSLNLYGRSYAEPTIEQSVFIAPPPKIIEIPQNVLPRSEPRLLRIPKIAMKRPLVNVGLLDDGTLQVPESSTVGGWYTGAPTPGELGPAVIVGHVDSPRGYTIFWHLLKLQPRDLIEVDRADGTTAKFEVIELRKFSQNDFPTQEVYGNTDHAGIRVITCGGTFNKKTQRYSENLVVYGKLVTH